MKLQDCFNSLVKSKPEQLKEGLSVNLSNIKQSYFHKLKYNAKSTETFAIIYNVGRNYVLIHSVVNMIKF